MIKLRRPALQLSIIWVMGITLCIWSIWQGQQHWQKNWFLIIVLPLLIICGLLLLTFQIMPYIFKSIRHGLRKKAKMTIIAILAGVGFIVTIGILSYTYEQKHSVKINIEKLIGEALKSGR